MATTQPTRSEPTESTLTLSEPPRELMVGDRIDFLFAQTRSQRLRMLLTRPRAHEIAAIRGTELSVRTRRMTWREWLSELWRALTDE